MRIAWVFLIVLLSTVGAKAQMSAIAGKPLMLTGLSATNPDCTSAGEVVLRVVSPASNGSLSIKRGGVFQNFAASNVRSACNRRRVQGVIAYYTAHRGYTGPDTLTLEYIGPSGQYGRKTFNILVR